VFLEIPEPADDESSDGGEYIPGSDSVADDMMDMETWTDDDMWTDGEEVSLDEEGFTESDSSFDRSSQRGDQEGIMEDVAPAMGQILNIEEFENDMLPSSSTEAPSGELE